MRGSLTALGSAHQASNLQAAPKGSTQQDRAATKAAPSADQLSQPLDAPRIQTPPGALCVFPSSHRRLGRCFLCSRRTEAEQPATIHSLVAKYTTPLQWCNKGLARSVTLLSLALFLDGALEPEDATLGVDHLPPVQA
jgi:hypothetical protein